MPITFDLVVCITSTALFDCSESHKIWQTEGLDAYKAHQRERIDAPLQPGVGFRLVHSLMQLNQCSPNRQLVDVVLMSRNDSGSGERIRNSLKHHKLGITRMSFTSGSDVTNYLVAFGCDLFLTTEPEQVHKILSTQTCDSFKGIAAGLVCNISIENTISSSWPRDQVRIVFDGDGVLFSDEAERVFRSHGLEAFRQFEQEKEHIALPEGPIHALALKLQKLRQGLGQDNSWRIRTFLVTARDSTTNERAFKTLKKWGLEIDETHFLGGLDKTPFLISIDPAIFFDDSGEHITRAQRFVPAAHILYGVLNTQSS